MPAERRDTPPADPGRVATDPRWESDPSPSFRELANAADFDILSEADVPASPCGDVMVVTQKLWPDVHPAAQEVRDGS